MVRHRKSRKTSRKKMEVIKLRKRKGAKENENIKFKKGGLHESLKFSGTFTKAEMTRLDKKKIGQKFTFKGNKFVMTDKLKDQVTLAKTMMSWNKKSRKASKKKSRKAKSRKASKNKPKRKSRKASKKKPKRKSRKAKRKSRKPKRKSRKASKKKSRKPKKKSRKASKNKSKRKSRKASKKKIRKPTKKSRKTSKKKSRKPKRKSLKYKIETTPVETKYALTQKGFDFVKENNKPYAELKQTLGEEERNYLETIESYGYLIPESISRVPPYYILNETQLEKAWKKNEGDFSYKDPDPNAYDDLIKAGYVVKK